MSVKAELEGIFLVKGRLSDFSITTTITIFIFLFLTLKFYDIYSNLLTLLAEQTHIALLVCVCAYIKYIIYI